MRPPRKWRPTLGFVLGGALAGTLVLSLIGLVVLRYLGPHIGFRPAAALLALLIGLATAGLGWLLVRLLLRPIHALEDYAAQVRQRPRDPVPPPEHFGTEELRATADSVIDMAGTLQRREAVIRSFTDHVTHEIKSPVAAIRAASELLQDGNLNDVDRRLVAQIAGAAGEIQTQLEALREAARAREPRYMGQTGLDVLELTHPALRIEVSGQAQVPLSCDGLRLVLGHLIDNAAAHGAGRVQILAKAEAGYVTLTVQDDGRGVSPGNRDRLFDAFFTTRREDDGTGMGLTIVRNTVEAHGGEIDHIPSDTGACFRIRFPV